MKNSKEFEKIITDFVIDMKTSFPEYEKIIEKWWKGGSNMEFLHNYCLKIYPDKFEEILYKSEELFQVGSQSEFLPGISFTHIWNYDDISDKNKDKIWNYLQMIMIAIVDEFRDNNNIVDSTNNQNNHLLDTFQSKEFNEKLTETINSLQQQLQQEKLLEEKEQEEQEGKNKKQREIDNEAHSKTFETLMDTKLANLAKEIAEETTIDFQDGMENIKDVNGVFEHILKDPAKLMNIVKNVGAKLDDKMKKGDLNETELLSEAASLMNRMKDIPGMQNIQEMMKKMGPAPTASSSKKPFKKHSFNKKNDDAYLNSLYSQMIQQQKQTNELEKSMK